MQQRCSRSRCNKGLFYFHQGKVNLIDLPQQGLAEGISSPLTQLKKFLLCPILEQWKALFFPLFFLRPL